MAVGSRFTYLQFLQRTHPISIQKMSEAQRSVARAVLRKCQGFRHCATSIKEKYIFFIGLFNIFAVLLSNRYTAHKFWNSKLHFKMMNGNKLQYIGRRISNNSNTHDDNFSFDVGLGPFWWLSEGDGQWTAVLNGNFVLLQRLFLQQ